MWCCSSPKSLPPPAALPKVVPSPVTTPAPPQLPGSNVPRAASSPCPWLRGSRVPLAGAPLGFLFLTIVSWPSVRWGQARKMNWCEQPSQAQLPPSSVSTVRMGPVLLGTWQRAQLPQGAARHTLHRGALPLILLLTAPGAVLLRDQPGFPNSHTHTLIIIIIIINH